MRKGFSLVEIAMILMVIALIVSGITVASTISENAKVRSVIKEIKDIQIAINNFYAQYNTLPGDMNNATDFWYNATTCPGISGTAGQCNGNGDGLIVGGGGTDSNEALRAWQHLNLAGMMPGNYSGVSTVFNQYDIGINIPASVFSPNGWWLHHFQAYSPNIVNINMFLGSFIAGGFANGHGSIRPIFGFKIDNKIDDTLPKTGKFRTCWSEDVDGWPCSVGGGVAPAAMWCAYASSNSYRLDSHYDYCTLNILLDIPN